MKDEEMAEESFEQYRTKDIDYVVSPYSEDNGTQKLMFNNEYDAEEEYFRFYKQGFLAGLKAGRPQWHKVADGDLPKDEDWKWCVSYRGYYYVAKYEEMFGCWTNQEYSEVMQPYAWKEIVLPEHKESE